MDFYYIGYTFSIALLGWVLACCISLCAAFLLYVTRVARGIIIGFSAFFGLLPFLLLPPILQAYGQVAFNVCGWPIFPSEVFLIVCACSFPVIEAASFETASVERRYNSLSRLSGLSKWRELKCLAYPYILGAVANASCGTLPVAVLLSVIFEWARGGRDGLGTIVQGIIQSGSHSDRVTLVITVGGLTFIPYVVSRALAVQFQNRFHLTTDSIDNTTPTRVPARKGTETLGWPLGLAAGALTYIVIWHVVASRDVLFETVQYTPRKFVTTLLWSTNHRIIGIDSPVSTVVVSAISTGFFGIAAAALGTLVAAITSVCAHKSRTFTALVSVLSSITQAVPIFVLIPFFLLFLSSRMSVALLVGVSVTYFHAFGIFRSKIDMTPSLWRDLLKIAVPQNAVRRLWREFRHWYAPMLLHYGPAAFVITVPYGITAALVADLFLGLDGLAWLAMFLARTDTYVNLLVINLCVVLMVMFYCVARISGTRLR